MRMHLSSHWKAFAVWQGQNKPCGLSAEDMQNSPNIWKCLLFCAVWKHLQYHIYHKRWWCDVHEPKWHFPRWAMYGNVIRENKGVHQYHIHNLWIHASGQVRKKCQRGTSSTNWWKSNRDPAGWFRTGEGFQDKAAIKNEWLFATNTVAPESFMGHVMEKYEGTNDRGNPLHRQTSTEQDSGDKCHWTAARPLTNIGFCL